MKVLDIGCGEGELMASIGGLGGGSLGIDPTLHSVRERSGFRLLPGFFPQDIPPDTGVFDAIMMLAVLEHFPDSAHAELSAGCRRFLKPGGLLVITVPSAAVDRILSVLLRLRLIDGMSLEEHHGFDVNQTPQIFASPDFDLVSHKRFQLGLNNLFVFRRN
jgi:2-polyprenyl-3-methyl-5-hydroxy-6-metoxy-1,4-benzoquinol methylase